MKLASSLVLAATLLAPAIAAAQPSQTPPPPPPPPGYGGGYYAAPPATEPGGFMNRRGRLAVGFGLGVGAMNAEGSDVLECTACDGNPAAVGIDFHIGGMLSSRLALLAEVQINGQVVDEDDYGVSTVTQAALMGAVQFWLTPRLWIKGGLGFASLQANYSDEYDDDYDATADIGTGGAALFAAGVELIQGRNFALDLQGRVLAAAYDDDETGFEDNVTSATIGIGLNWY
jgi:hypothetical protein